VRHPDRPGPLAVPSRGVFELPRPVLLFPPRLYVLFRPTAELVFLCSAASTVAPLEKTLIGLVKIRNRLSALRMLFPQPPTPWHTGVATAVARSSVVSLRFDLWRKIVPSDLRPRTCCILRLDRLSQGCVSTRRCAPCLSG